MSGQQHEKTRERAPANLGIKFNPALGATNSKRFSATVRALLKSNQESGELALAVLEGRANSSKESLVLFEPRATDYAKVLAGEVVMRKFRSLYARGQITMWAPPGDDAFPSSRQVDIGQAAESP